VLSALLLILPHEKWVKQLLQDAADGPVTHAANGLADQEEYERAADIYADLITLSPDDPARYLPLGQMFVALQQYDGAFEVFSRGLSLDPQAPYLWRAIAFAYILREQYEDSQRIFDDLIEQDPKDAESWAGLGRIQALSGSYCLAEQYYDKALSLAPENLTALAFLSDLQQDEKFNISSLYTYRKLYKAVESDLMSGSDPLPKWIVRGYDKVLELGRPTAHLIGAYHEERQWDPTEDKWSAQYLVYGGGALFNDPISDEFTAFGSFSDQCFVLKDLLVHTDEYFFDVQRFHLGARGVYNRAWFVDAKLGLSYYCPPKRTTFKSLSGLIAEPSITMTYHTPIQKASLALLTTSDLVARNFNTHKAKMVGYYTAAGSYERKVWRRTWAGMELNANWYRDFVHNSSQRVSGWLQWRPPWYSDNIIFRYNVTCQTFAKNIPDYYTYKPEITNKLQVTFEKSWRVGWADTLYTSLSYGHGWQDTRSRFAQIIVVAPTAAAGPMKWTHRQTNIVLATLAYTYDHLKLSMLGDYYRDSEKYTIWNIGAELQWRF
jgi:tetratricopeptide (TPR) repeat protein